MDSSSDTNQNIGGVEEEDEVEDVEEQTEGLLPSSINGSDDDGGSTGEGIRNTRLEKLKQSERSEKRRRYGEGTNGHQSENIRRVLLRLSLVAGTGVVAFVVQDLEQLLGVIGSMGGAVLTLVLPALISLKCRPAKYRHFVITCLDVLFVITGTIAGVWGSVVSLEYNRLKSS
jgi:hypothetical protein